MLKAAHGIKRGNLYNVLRSLKQLNLVTEEKAPAKRTIFRPRSPYDLEYLLDVKEKNIAIARTELNAVLPALKSLFVSSSGKPGVQYFEGWDAVTKTYDDILRIARKELLVFHASFTDEEAIGSSYYTKYLRSKARKGVHTKIIFPDLPHYKELPLEDKQYKINRKFIRNDRFNMLGDIAIYADNVAVLILQKGKRIGFIIENKNFTDSLRQVFYLLWETL